MNNVVQAKESNMDTELMLDVGQANELKLAFRRHGWSNAEIKKLCKGNLLAHLLPLVREYGNITAVMTTQHLINCDADPFLPHYLSGVVSHQKDGQLVFDSTKIKLHFSPNQINGKYMRGEQLRMELANEPVLNANILDYLLAHPTLIPDEWEGKYIFFWGTIYHNSKNSLYVRCLYFHVGKWRSDYYWLGSGWGGSYPAAVRAS